MCVFVARVCLHFLHACPLPAQTLRREDRSVALQKQSFTERALHRGGKNREAKQIPKNVQMGPVDEKKSPTLQFLTVFPYYGYSSRARSCSG